MEKLQVAEANKLLNLVQGNNLKDPLIRDTIYNFSRKYSSIAAERILNYHLNDCIVKFSKTIDVPCVIKESQKIIDAFSSQFGFTDDKTIKKLIEKIHWDTRELQLSTIHLLSNNFLEHFKPLIIEKARTKVSKIIESQGICSFENTKNDEISSIESQVASIIPKHEFETILLEQYTIYLSNNIYQVIRERPELLESFKSLLLDNSDEFIMNNMINSIKDGLFNIGNSTEEVLFIFEALIPFIRQLDRSGYVLDSCLKEAQSYLTHFRKDLNEALLNFLLKHKNSEFLLKEFEEQKGKNNLFALEYPTLMTGDWKPDPIYIQTFINPEIRTANPINLLISHLSINDSLSENYRKKIAEKLLKVENLEEVEEITEEVELLRKKCGDSFVSSLNIMINDVIESKGKSLETTDLKVTIISHRYWPEFEDKESIEHPEIVSEKLKVISSAYSRQFEDKKIIWRPQMDEVKVSLEFPSGTFLFTCPVEAAILINSFDFPLSAEDEEFDISMAAALTGISDRKILKNAIKFWLKKRVIIRSKLNFKFVHDFDPREGDCVDSHLTLFDSKEAEIYADEEESSDSDTAIFQQKYWPIISNMLKTFGQISAERIHSTLKMYSKEYKEPLDSLVKFLQSRVKEGILQSHGNRIILYCLINK